MKPFRVPPALHDLFGENAAPLQIAAVLLFGVLTATGLTLLLQPTLTELPWWRIALGWALTADIAAGCVANFTRSTNDYYAKRARNRWIFIALHFHVIGVAWAFDDSISASLAVWAYTIAAATVVNLLSTRPTQVFVAGLLLAVGLTWIPLYPGVAAPVLAVQLLFLLKVMFSFAVDHYRSFEPPAAKASFHPELRAPGKRRPGGVR